MSPRAAWITSDSNSAAVIFTQEAPISVRRSMHTPLGAFAARRARSHGTVIWDLTAATGLSDHDPS